MWSRWIAVAALAAVAACGGSSSSAPALFAPASSEPDHRVFALDGPGGAFSILDGGAVGTPALAGFAVDGPAGGFALDPYANRIWISEHDRGRVAVFDASFLIRLATIPVGAGPGRIAIDGLNARVFVANEDDGTVSILDADTFEEHPDSPKTVGSHPADLVLQADTIVVANRDSNDLSVFSALPPFPNAGGSPFPVDAAPVDLEVDPGESIVFVANRDGGSISVYNVTAGAVSTPVVGLDRPVQLARHGRRDLLFAALAGDATLRVFSSTATPVERGDSPVALPGTPAGVAASGFLDRVWVSDAGGAVRTIDGEPPFAPLALTFLPGSPASLFAIEPVRLHVLRSPLGGNVEACRVVGPRLYVAHGGAGLIVLDNANPRAGYAERELGRVVMPGIAVDVETDGETAFVSNDFEGVQVADIRDLAQPVIIRTVAGIGQADELRWHGSNLIVDSNPYGIYVIDVSRPDMAAVIGAHNPGASGFGFDYARDRRLAYSASGGPDIRIVDLSSPTQPRTAEIAPVPVDALDVAALPNGYAAVAAGVGGLRILKIAPKSSAGSTNVGVLAFPGSVNRVTSDRDWVFVTDGANDLHLVDVRDPGAPRLVGTLDPLGPVDHILPSGNNLYVSEGGTGLVIYRFYR